MNPIPLIVKWLRHPISICLLLGLIAAMILVALQSLGSLQGLELRTFDQFLLRRPVSQIDNRIVLIDETEADIRRYGHPLPDQVFADVLQALENAGARVIGVDK